MKGTFDYTVRRMTILLVGILLLAILIGLIIVTSGMLVSVLGRILIVAIIALAALAAAIIIAMPERTALRPLAMQTGRDMLAIKNTTLKVYSRVLETASDAIILFDDEGLIEYINRVAIESLGYDMEDMTARPFSEFIFDQDGDVWASIKHAISKGRSFKGELTIVQKDDTKAAYEATVSPIMNDDGELAHVAAILRNVSQKKKYEDKLIYIAQHDALTDLPNRVYFLDVLRAAIEEAELTSRRIAIVHININGFKYVNEALGHAAGDELLCEVAQRLKGRLKNAAFIAHMGADEFMALLKSVDTEEQIDLCAKDIFAILEAPYNLAERDYSITVSIGSSVYPDDGIDAQTLMQNSDLAMNKAKAMGGNHHESYYEGLSDEISMRMRVDIELRRAIENKELAPYFQPIMNAVDGTVTSCEALVRWISPTEGIVPPARFIPFATATGLIFPITAIMLLESLKSMKRIHDQGYKITVAVNVPVQVLLNREFMNTVKHALRESNMEPRYLNVEITEDTLVLDSEIALERLSELRSMGIGISVDDFGTGYSSLSYLKRLAPQRVKIDKWFIGGIPEDDEHVAIVKAILALSNSLGLYTTAEGVEFEAQREYLTKQGCTHLQGYLISRPVPEEQFLRFVQNNSVSK